METTRRSFLTSLLPTGTGRETNKGEGGNPRENRESPLSNVTVVEYIPRLDASLWVKDNEEDLSDKMEEANIVLPPNLFIIWANKDRPPNIPKQVSYPNDATYEGYKPFSFKDLWEELRTKIISGHRIINYEDRVNYTFGMDSPLPPPDENDVVKAVPDTPSNITSATATVAPVLKRNEGFQTITRRSFLRGSACLAAIIALPRFLRPRKEEGQRKRKGNYKINHLTSALNLLKVVSGLGETDVVMAEKLTKELAEKRNPESLKKEIQAYADYIINGVLEDYKGGIEETVDPAKRFVETVFSLFPDTRTLSLGYSSLETQVTDPNIPSARKIIIETIIKELKKADKEAEGKYTTKVAMLSNILSEFAERMFWEEMQRYRSIQEPSGKQQLQESKNEIPGSANTKILYYGGMQRLLNPDTEEYDINTTIVGLISINGQVYPILSESKEEQDNKDDPPKFDNFVLVGNQKININDVVEDYLESSRQN